MEGWEGVGLGRKSGRPGTERGNAGLSGGRDEAITAAVDGLDEARNPGLIAEHLADFPHRGRQDRLANRRVRPRRRQKVVLRDQLASLAEQTLQYRNRLVP